MMSKRFKDDEDLVSAVHGLPGSIKPQRDLWPGIVARLRKAQGTGNSARRGPPWLGQAAAASVAIAFVAGLMLGRQIDSETNAGGQAVSMDPAMRSAMVASELEYQAAFREFIPVGMARNLLETQAVENIESSWADLQQAESALLAALRDYPENTYLNQKLLDLRAQQLGFMRQLATLDQFSRRKT